MRAVKWHAQQMGVELLADLVVGQLRMQLWERQAQLRVVQVGGVLGGGASMK
jgi:hypothetical protein